MNELAQNIVAIAAVAGSAWFICARLARQLSPMFGKKTSRGGCADCGACGAASSDEPRPLGTPDGLITLSTMAPRRNRPTESSSNSGRPAS